MNCSYNPKHISIESNLDSLSKRTDSLKSILTNKLLSFKNGYVIETGLSDFHKMIVAVMKINFLRMKPQVVNYQKYKDFHNETFLDSLRHELNAQGECINGILYLGLLENRLTF